MANHPNRNWRKRLEASANQWLEDDDIKSSIQIITSTRDENITRKAFKQAYKSGFKACKEFNKPPIKKE